jgi:hypothetical protein
MLHRRQHGQVASLQVPHRYPAAGVLTLQEGCRPHSGEHCASTGLRFVIENDFGLSSQAIHSFTQSSSASRYSEGELFRPKPVDNIMFPSRWVDMTC